MFRSLRHRSLPHGRSTRRRRVRPWLVVPAALAAGLGMSATAMGLGPSFTDVPASHPFHDEIGAVASGGIARGYPDGSYRPADFITRQAMAAFLSRGLGRAAFASGGGNSTGTADRTLASVTVADDASGYVVLHAAAHGSVTTGTNCPCLIETRLTSGGTHSPLNTTELGGEEHAGGSVTGSTSNVWLVPVSGVGSTTVALVARRVNAMTGNPSTSFEGSLTAEFVPFDATGTFSG